MAISYPLTPPSDGYASIRILARDVVGMAESPFTLIQDVQAFSGQRWEADIALPPMRRAEYGAYWEAFLLSLKGRLGTFLMGDPLAKTPRGTWAGSPLVFGAHAAGASSVTIDGFSAGATAKAGDALQFGTGSGSRMHKVLADVTEAAGAMTLDIWPNLRAALADNATIITQNARCVWRLASNDRAWDEGLSQIYGFRFSAIEAL